jgi:2-succinyl-5-enolpyruvyl-6-hydroxy-3-cyclohexene-1-carboxylate synthase
MGRTWCEKKFSEENIWTQFMKNIDLVKTTFHILKSLGVKDLIVCAGARNLPIVAALEDTGQDFQVESYFEERSAGFYALGRIKSHSNPVAVVTTSGTAVAELLPAVIEAYYQNLPLIVISADRPKSYRGSGSPQSIEHVGIFSSYVDSVCDWDVNEAEFKVWTSRCRPLHLNLCFDEPLIDGKLSAAQGKNPQLIMKEIPSLQIQDSLLIQNPVAILAQIKESDQKLVQDFLVENRIVHYAEFLSGLRGVPELADLQIQSGDDFVKRLFTEGKANSIIRIGGIPTLRFWRDLEGQFKNVPVYSFSDLPFSGLSRKSQLYPISELSKVNVADQVPKLILNSDRYLQGLKHKLFSKLENSEHNTIRQLSKVIGDQPLYIGNSLPIRLWDLCSDQVQSSQPVCANRGANGIDGQISTYLGWAQNKTESWCLVGDLTALYDLAALGLAQSSTNKMRIVIVNNSGGQIFSRILGNKKYLNPQTVDFKSWAAMWSWDFVQIKNQNEMSELKKFSATRLIIEICPDNSQTDEFWTSWDSLCKQ